jgi:DNA helicase-2/ATP-dependent DNA helicase PcrA
MSDVSLSDIEITGIEDCPVDTSVKLNGPPGTGKTTESAARVAKLLEEYDYRLADVLWGTYRRSLAMETLDRLAEWDVIPESELSDPSDGPTRYISTMHAVASRLVGGVGEPAHYGDKKKFCMKRGLRYDKKSAWDEPPGQTLFDVFTYAANNLLDLHDPQDRDKIPKIDTLRDETTCDVGRAWDAWQDYKAQNDKIDFWEQLAAPLRRDVTPNQPIVVVDEYHDATPLMAKLAESWIESAEIAIVAGDPLQVVNTYAGARPKFYNRVDLPEIQLPKAWERPPTQHWEVATNLLSNAHDTPNVEIGNSGSFHIGQSPGFGHTDADGWHVPAADTPRSPGWMIDEFGTDTMFLCRTQKQAGGVARALEKAGVLFEVQSSMDMDGWGAREDMAERTAIYNALQRLDGVTGEQRTGGGLSRYSETSGKTIDDLKLRHKEAAAILDHASAKHLEGSRDEVTEYANDIENAETVVEGAEIAGYVTEEFWNIYSRGPGAVRHLNKSSNRTEGGRLGVRDSEALKAALQQNDAPVKSVDTKVYTIHASKGSEAHNVVVYDGITKRIRKSMQNNEPERKNEWRTWYVALTRSRSNLFVLRDGFEWTVPFLPENLLETAKSAHEGETA